MATASTQSNVASMNPSMLSTLEQRFQEVPSSNNFSADKLEQVSMNSSRGSINGSKIASVASLRNKFNRKSPRSSGPSSPLSIPSPPSIISGSPVSLPSTPPTPPTPFLQQLGQIPPPPPLSPGLPPPPPPPSSTIPPPPPPPPSSTIPPPPPPPMIPPPPPVGFIGQYPPAGNPPIRKITPNERKKMAQSVRQKIKYQGRNVFNRNSYPYLNVRSRTVSQRKPTPNNLKNLIRNNALPAQILNTRRANLTPQRTNIILGNNTSPATMRLLRGELLKTATPMNVMNVNYSKRESFATVYYDKHRKIYKGFFYMGDTPYLVESKDCTDLFKKLKETEYIRNKFERACGPVPSGVSLENHITKCSPLETFEANNKREAEGKAQLQQYAKQAAASKAELARKKALADAAEEQAEFILTNKIIREIGSHVTNATGRSGYGPKILQSYLNTMKNKRGMPNVDKQRRVKRRVNYYIATGKTLKAKTFANEKAEYNRLTKAAANLAKKQSNNATRKQAQQKQKNINSKAKKVIDALTSSYKTQSARQKVVDDILKVALATEKNASIRNEVEKRVRAYVAKPEPTGLRKLFGFAPK